MLLKAEIINYGEVTYREAKKNSLIASDLDKPVSVSLTHWRYFPRTAIDATEFSARIWRAADWSIWRVAETGLAWNYKIVHQEDDKEKIVQSIRKM